MPLILWGGDILLKFNIQTSKKDAFFKFNNSTRMLMVLLGTKKTMTTFRFQLT